MKKFVLGCIAAGACLSMSGCAYFYRADDDKAAQTAVKSFNDAALGKTLEAERGALVKTQQDRQNLVKRSQLALRDASLARIIGGTGTEYTWGALGEWTQKRVFAIRGTDTAAPLPANCERLLNNAISDQHFAATQTLLDADKIAVYGTNMSSAFKVACDAQPSQPPAGLIGDAVAIALARNFDRACERARVAVSCVKAHLGVGGALQAIEAQLDANAAERKSVENQIKELDEKYRTDLAAADAAKPKDGDAKLLAAKLQQRLDDIAALADKASDTAKKSGQAGFFELAKLDAMEKKKAVLEGYIAAIEGKDAADASLGQHRAYLIANLVNRATDRPAPPTAGIVLQAELYRQQIAASQARIKRLDDTEMLIKVKRDYLTMELAYLEEAALHLEAAARPGACDIGKSFNDAIARGDGCSITAASALLAFTSAWTLGRMPYEQTDYRLIDQDELTALDESESALRQSEGVIRLALDQVAKLNASGIKPEEIANLWQALGITAIAVRIK